jgi:hypothetical protein
MTIGTNELKAKIAKAHLYKKRVINAIQLVYDGVRWKLTNCFVEIGRGSSDNMQLRETVK